MTARGVFVAGTDTGVGKTFVAAALARGLARDGLRVAVMKPVAAGVAPHERLPADVIALTNAANVDAPQADVNPYAFAPFVAPHIAAAEAGVTIDVERIAQAYERLAARADAVVVEGAGGALVPLGGRNDMLDIAARLRLPLLLVVGIRLGCINHALLTALAVRARGLELRAWIANRIDAHMGAAAQNVQTLTGALAAPLCADIGWREGGEAFALRGMAERLWH